MTSPSNKTIVLRARPNGWVGPEHFACEQRPAPAHVPAPGKLIVRTRYLSVDPYMRGRMNAQKSYIEPFEPGQPIVSGGIGEVVVTDESEPFRVGDLVQGMLPWQEVAQVDAVSVRAVLPNAPLTAQLGVLGMPGLTAYAGLFDVGQAKPGETVFVSGAAGAVGSAVGQFAKIHGCRVAGSAGSDAKVRYLREELGFDAAFNYKQGRLDEQLREACPEGIDVYFDNVGGAMLEAVLSQLKVHARIAICGMISLYNEAEPLPGPRNLAVLIQKRARMEGFLVRDHSARTKAFLTDATRWLAEGKLTYHETFYDGIENAPAAFVGMLKGENLGKMLVRVQPGV